MKLPSLLLAGSLAANAALVAVYFAVSPPSGVAPTTASAKNSANRSSNSAQTTQLAEAWAQLQSGDPDTLAARLRAAGLPPALVREIVAAKNSSATPASGEFPSDQPARFSNPPGLPSARAAAARALSDFERKYYGDLPREKIKQIQGINSDYSALTKEIYDRTKGVLLPEDRAQLAYLEKEKLADLAKTLDPQELEDYLMRRSDTASRLRSQLAGFNPSDDEFRAIFRAASAVENQSGSPITTGVSNYLETTRKREAAILAQLQSTLSPERLADYKLATDPASSGIYRLVARLELPPGTTQQVLAVQTETQQQATAVRTNRSLTPEARNAQLSALAQDATAKLNTVLTPRGYEAYKETSGHWLQNLQPRPVPLARRPGG